MIWLSETPPDIVKIYIPRYYASSQESALMTVLTLAGRAPVMKKQTWLEILQCNTEVLHMLVKCALMPRTTWYPESMADGMACEVLALIFNFPSHYPLSVEPHSMQSSAEQALLAEGKVEWKAMEQIVKLFTARDGWAESIIGIWAKISSEKWQTVNKCGGQSDDDALD